MKPGLRVLCRVFEDETGDGLLKVFGRSWELPSRSRSFLPKVDSGLQGIPGQPRREEDDWKLHK